MPSPKRKLGDTGEEVACKYLESKGFRVLERNYLRKWGEIDIVAEKGSLLSFVEVKSVTREPHEIGKPAISRGYRPEENVHPAKLKRLHRAIQTYLLDRKVPEDRPWRVDVACVYLDFSTRKAKVEMLENVIL
ncbi:YraN family protein [Candidatus Kaiserbacteria bacterium]|nr:YraN family protein [Candidatus Kaiserbacteria bacterium]